MAVPFIPVRSRTTQEVLYGDRVTSYSWEVLEHLPVQYNLEENPRALSTGSLGAFGTRWGWTRTFHTSGAETIPMPFGTLARLTSVETGTFGGRGFDSYGNADLVTPGTTGDWVDGPAVTPGSTITVSRWVRMGTTSAVSAYQLMIRFHNGAGSWVDGIVGGPVVVPPVPATWVRISNTIRVPEGATRFSASARVNATVTTSSFIDMTALQTSLSDSPYFDGGTGDGTYWSGVPNLSSSAKVSTSDRLIGTLDGVSEGQLGWNLYQQVKGGGSAQVIDLETAAPGMLRIGDLPLESLRLRPVCKVSGLLDQPLGTYLVTSAKEQWDATGRTWSLELLDRCTVPAQDKVDQTYAVAAGTGILQEVKNLLLSSGETISIDESNTLATSTGMVWEVGTSKLNIINDLLNVADYNALWMDGYGNLRATPRVLPADRSIDYELLGIPRELRSGEQSIYDPSWTLERDSFNVPNKVIAVQAAGGEDEPAIVGVWTNEDPNSPYSYPRRGRWIPHVLDSVETPEAEPEEVLAFLQQRARTTLIQMSSTQAVVEVTHLPIPVRVGDVLVFANTRAGVEARHVITALKLELNSLGLMSSTLQEVISL